MSLAVPPIKCVCQLHQMSLASNPCVIVTDKT